MELSGQLHALLPFLSLNRRLCLFLIHSRCRVLQIQYENCYWYQESKPSHLAHSQLHILLAGFYHWFSNWARLKPFANRYYQAPCFNDMWGLQSSVLSTLLMSHLHQNMSIFSTKVFYHSHKIKLRLSLP